MDVSRSLVVRFSQDMAELYTDLLGLGEATESGALFATAQRLVESLRHEDSREGGSAVPGSSARFSARSCREPPGATVPTIADVAELLALSVLARLTELDRRGMLLRPGRRRRLFGITLSLLKAIRRQRALAGQPSRWHRDTHRSNERTA